MQPQRAKEEGAPACQALSYLDTLCSAPAIMHCLSCDRWFCQEHAADGDWHECAQGDFQITCSVWPFAHPFIGFRGRKEPSLNQLPNRFARGMRFPNESFNR